MFAFIAIILTIILIVLVALNVIKPRWYAHVIYFIGLGAVYSTTLLGVSVVGSDISRELLMSRLSLLNGWDLTLFDITNTSFVVGFFIPSVSLLVYDIDPVLIYKYYLPLVFSFTPVILYFIFKKQFGDIKAFYAAMFFITMPVFSLEIPTIGKSMVAETLMALTLWVMFTDWKSLKKGIVMFILLLFTIWAHYTVGLLLMIYLFGMIFVMLVVKLLPKWKLLVNKSVSLLVVSIVVVCTFIPAFIYFSNVSQGIVTRAIFATTKVNILGIDGEKFEGALVITPTDPLVNIGVGADFIEASVGGKIFRVIQYGTQFLICIGALWLVFKHKLYKFRAEFIACIGGSFLLLACCVFIPHFSIQINMTRFYHITLFFLAPLFVLGFDALTKRYYQSDGIESRIGKT